MDRLTSNQGLSHLVLHILSYVDIKQDIINCMLVCKDWKDLIESSIHIWKRRLKFVYMDAWNHDHWRECRIPDQWEDFIQVYAKIQKSKDLEKVKRFAFLLEKYVIAGRLSENPFHWYAEKKNGRAEDCMFFVEIATTLKNAGADTFNKACRDGNVDLVRSLIEVSKCKDIDLNQKSYGLMNAAYFGHLEVLKLLFDKSEEMQIDLSVIGATSPFGGIGGNVFTWAFHSDSPELFDLLLNNYQNAGIELNYTDFHGNTSFMKMCSMVFWSTNVIDFMIENANELFIDFNEGKNEQYEKMEGEDDFGDTGLMIACQEGNFYVVKKLLEHCERNGIYLKMVNIYSQMTVLQMACQCLPLLEAVDEGWITIEEQRERSRRTVEILLEHAARYSGSDPSMNLYLDVNAKADSGGRTAYEIAVLAGREDLVELFNNYAKAEK